MEEHQTAFGVFKPVGHVVLSFRDPADAAGAAAALLASGFSDADVVRYTPQAMAAQAESDIQQAGVLASLGQELNLVKAHLELARHGHSFLVVHAPDDAEVSSVTEVATAFNAGRAQRYGRLLIEELLEVGADEPQVAESPDRGLDAQTPSGQQAERGHER